MPMRCAVPLRYRELFFATNGFGPYSCFFCGQDVDTESVLVHHDDHNHENNAVENLKPAHHVCHTRHHHCVPKSDAHKEKLRQASLGQKQSAETRAKKSLASRGRRHTVEAKAKVSAARRGKPLTAEHRAKLSLAKLGNTNGFKPGNNHGR